MHSLIRRISELQGLYVRLHINGGQGTGTIDGVYRGVEKEAIVLDPSSHGERVLVPVEQVVAVTQLPGDCREENSQA